MNTQFDGDEVIVTLNKTERAILRKARTLARELGRYKESAGKTADGIKDIIDAIDADGVFAHQPLPESTPKIIKGSDLPARADAEPEKKGGAK